MKNLELHTKADKCNNENDSQMIKANILLKTFLIIFVSSWIFLLSSCYVFWGGWHGGHRGGGHWEHHR